MTLGNNKLDASVEPRGDIEMVRVLFRSDKYPDFYFVEMVEEEDFFQAVLPKPSRGTN